MITAECSSYLQERAGRHEPDEMPLFEVVDNVSPGSLPSDTPRCLFGKYSRITSPATRLTVGNRLSKKNRIEIRNAPSMRQDAPPRSMFHGNGLDVEKGKWSQTFS